MRYIVDVRGFLDSVLTVCDVKGRRACEQQTEQKPDVLESAHCVSTLRSRPSPKGSDSSCGFGGAPAKDELSHGVSGVHA